MFSSSASTKMLAIFSFLINYLLVQGTKVETYAFHSSIHTLSQTYKVTANGVNVPVIKYQPYDFAQLSTDGAIDIVVTKLNNNNVGSYSISPKKLGLKATISKDTISFKLPTPQYLIIKLDERQELVIMVDALEDAAEAVNSKDASVRLITSSKYSADATGKNYATTAIQKAIDDASGAGGGTVYIPPGVYKCGNLVLKSNVHLYLAGGAVLRYTGEANVYTQWFDKNGRHFTYWIRTDFNSQNIKITGRGMFDGDGKATYADKAKLGLTVLAPILTKNFYISGVVLKEASYWNTHVQYSSNVYMRNLKVLDRFDMGENDGIDITESSDVVIRNAIATAWDDPFSVKAYNPGKGTFSKIKTTARASENILFDGLVSWTGLYGAKLGQGFVSPIRNVTFRNVVVYDCSVGIGIDHKYGTAAGSDILFENFEIEQVTSYVSGRTTWLVMQVEDGAKNGQVGSFGDVVVRNVTLYSMGKTQAEISGFNSSVEAGKVTLEQIRPMTLGGRFANKLTEMNIMKTHFAPKIVVANSAKDSGFISQNRRRASRRQRR